MSLVSQSPPPLGEHRACVREYLREIALPFESVAGEIVRERLACELEDDLLRPSLALYACSACGGDVRDALPVAASFYMFDRFVQMHDELVEDRYSARWGLGQSLNAGDALYALGFRTLAEGAIDAPRRLAAAGVVGRAVLEAIEGRNVDLERGVPGRPDGLLVKARSLRRRSAALTAAALCAGSLIAGAPEVSQRAFGRAGRLLAAVGAIGNRELARRLGEKTMSVIRRCVGDAAHQAAFEEAVLY
ncbi:MAG TPA: hypothetical protein VNG31_03985, partial [Candidatus Baltobacteraceae bacterium]|nr:hypothetical protein [Candidatus Baltobacteraceae bacterium]